MLPISKEMKDWVRSQIPWFIDEWDTLFWPRVAGVFTGFCLTWYVLNRFWRHRQLVERVRDKRYSVRNACKQLVERLRTEGLSLAHQEKILNLSLKELQSDLQTGKLQAMEVLRAYQSKAMEVTERVNCVVEPILEAEAQAAELDLQTGKKGPLHGIPISVKESYFIKGYDCTAGMQFFIDKPLDHDAPIVQVLKKQGAIPFVRTNIPQTMMTFDSSNPVYGETLNPHNATRSPGGSSSGEGALIGGGGSCLGIGSDIGGSIRIPSHLCGVCGLKPTVERLGNAGMFSLGSGQTLVKVASGPLARDVDSLALVMKALLVPDLQKAWPLTQVMPFDTKVYESRTPLRVGYYVDNGIVPPVPACVRGLEMARAALQKKGHTLVKFEIPRVRHMFMDLFMRTAFADEDEESRSYLNNDLLDKSCRLAYYMFSVPYCIRYLLSLPLQLVDADIAHTLRLRVSSIPDWFKLAEEIESYQLEFIAAMKKQNLDVILCPTFPVPAFPVGRSSDITAAVSYTVLYNVLNFPAGVVPITRVTETDQSRLNDPSIYPTHSLYEKMTKKVSQGAENLPVSVQCAALPYQEELVLRVMKEIEQEVHYK